MIRSGKPLRVVLVIGSAARGGAEGQLVRLASELQDRGLIIRVLFLTGGGPLVADLDAAGVPWEALRPTLGVRTSTGRNLVMMARLGRRLATSRPDVVFAWLPGAIWMTLPLAALLTRARRIAAVRGMVSEKAPFRPVLRHAIKRAHAVTINAPHLRADAEAWGARPHRVIFVPNGVDIPLEPSLVDREPALAIVLANFRCYKGHDVLVEALTQVDPRLYVRLVGEGSELEPTRTRATELGVIDRLQFADYPADVAYELSCAQFAIHPSRTEGLSNAILEELAMGLPVVAAGVGGNGVLVEDGVNGFLVPSGEPRLLAERISQVAASPELRRKMSAAARDRAHDFSWDVCVGTYVQLFATLTRSRWSSL